MFWVLLISFLLWWAMQSTYTSHASTNRSVVIAGLFVTFIMVLTAVWVGAIVFP